MMGKKAIEAARIFVEETGISDSLSAEDFIVERESMLQSMFPTSELMPGMLSTCINFCFCFSSFFQRTTILLYHLDSVYLRA